MSVKEHYTIRINKITQFFGDVSLPGKDLWGNQKRKCTMILSFFMNTDIDGRYHGKPNDT